MSSVCRCKVADGELVKAAVKARKLAYCPYSKYRVGAVVVGASGAVYTGANVENASFGLTVCAERIAIFKAITGGEKAIKAVYVAAKMPNPCGACRQVMAEFMRPDGKVVLISATGEGRIRRVETQTLKTLLPHAFSPAGAGL
ncbi:MAG: cytidine deaminase [Elusimicrobia bacterium]|nr:cytidine deaminase [Elusimicrobiota bacterium]